MVTVAKHDFVELSYVGKVKGGKVFDVTSAEDAKKYDIFDERATYTPRVVCVGLGYVIRGLDKALEGKEVGKEYSIEVVQREAFGPRRKQLVKIVSTQLLVKQNIRPMVGLTIVVGDRLGTIRSVAGGRTTVDLNHPLSGKDLEYTFTITKKITDIKKQVASVLSHGLRMGEKDYTLAVKDKKVTITPKQKLPAHITANFLKLCKEVFKGHEIAFS